MARKRPNEIERYSLFTRRDHFPLSENPSLNARWTPTSSEKKFPHVAKSAYLCTREKDYFLFMKILSHPIKHSDLDAMLPGFFGDMIKVVVDVRQGIVGIDAELHADIEKEMLSRGSQQADLWGINLYPEMEGDDFVEFDSLINIRPHQGNRSRDVQDPAVRRRIVDIVNNLIQ